MDKEVKVYASAETRQFFTAIAASLLTFLFIEIARTLKKEKEGVADNSRR